MTISAIAVDHASRRRQRARGACVICGAVDGPILRREGEFVARGCDCGIVYTDPAPAPGEVDPTDDIHSRAFYSLSERRRMRWLRRHHPCGRTLLEVGCGPGDLLVHAQASGYDVSGIEADAGRADRVRTRFGIDVQHGMFEDVPVRAASVDIVYHCDLLSHFADPIAALTKMRHALAPGGVIFLEVGVVSRHAMGWFDLVGGSGMPDHRQFYDDDGLVATAAAAGLRIVASRRFGLAPSLLLAGARRRLTGDDAVPAPRRLADEDRSPSWRSRVHNAMRYGAGALTPGWGPGTTFVLLAPITPSSP